VHGVPELNFENFKLWRIWKRQRTREAALFRCAALFFLEIQRVFLRQNSLHGEKISCFRSHFLFSDTP